MKKLTTFLWARHLALSCFKQLPLTSRVIFELWIHLSFGTRVIPGVLVSSILSSDKPLDFHATTVSVTQVGILKVLEFGWNIK